ncbi:hypothetical protein [Desulforhopalus sp. 52FAK]
MSIDNKSWNAVGFVKAVILFTLLFPQFTGAHDVDGNHQEGLAEAIHALQVAAGQTPSSSDPTGNAQPDQVLEGVTFSNVNELGLTGTMPDNGTLTITPGVNEQAIPEGYHSGAGTVPGAEDLLSNNIKSGITLYGVVGDPMVVDTSEGDAVAADIKVNRIVYVDGVMVTGTNHGPWGCVAEGFWHNTTCIYQCMELGKLPYATCASACQNIYYDYELSEMMRKQCF